MSAPTTMARNRIFVGDALRRLQTLPDASVDCVVSSPPYYSLRDYNAPRQIGLERHVDHWVDNLAVISEQVRRVLVPTGTFWLNLGDTYSSHQSQGAQRKGMLMAPERLAIRLQQDGWIIRNRVIWAKPNPVPSSVPDRLNCTYEVIYIFAKQQTYFFDLDAIREPPRTRTSATRNRDKAAAQDQWRGPNSMPSTGLHALKAQGRVAHPLGKNPGDVWTIAPGGYRSAHHATFPLVLAERMIAASCPEARCRRCLLPWKRRVIRGLGGTATRAALAPTCPCNQASEPGLVLDPFMGSGTTAVAAENLGRDWLGIELNPDFAAAAQNRITDTHQDEPPAPSSKRTAA